MTYEVDTRSVESLLLDSENPRLPEEYQGESQERLLSIFYRDYNLDELAASYIANGFFPSESLLILDDGTVLEGNRRLAALKYLLHDSTAQNANLPEYFADEMPTSAQLESLEVIPVQIVGSRENLAAYLGFRHIKGAKEWSAAAKARFVTNRVREHASRKSENPFADVGRETGSNALGVRNRYIHFSLLQKARFALSSKREVEYVLNERFGVWERLANAEGVYEYIGYDSSARTLDEINDAFEELDLEAFSKLLADLYSEEGRSPILNDSRMVTSYAKMLSNEKAMGVLRESGDFHLAEIIAFGSPINQELETIDKKLEILGNSLIEDDALVEPATARLVGRIKRRLSSLEGTIRGLLEGQERDA